MVVLWCGPVQASTLEMARWNGPTPTIATFNSGSGGGIGSTAFAELGAELAKKHGTPLRGLLASKGLDPATTEPIVLCGFSAAHGLIEAVLHTDADRARVGAVGAFDAYYTSAAKTPKPGYRAFAELAAAGERRMLMTSSHIGGPTYPSGADAAAALLAPLALEPIDPRTIDKATCETGAGRGGLAWYVYANRKDKADPGANLRASHVQHATILAPVLAPELAAAVGSSSTPGLDMGDVVALVLLAWGASHLLERLA